MRYAQLALGGLLLVAAAVIAPLPGPGGVFPFSAGMILILRNSPAARRRFARMKRRRPRLGGAIDLALRRGSTLRRRARDRAAAR